METNIKKWRKERAEAIVRDFKKAKGDKTAIIDMLCEKYKVSLSTIYNILRNETGN
jgi:Mor family transcriptional regulator